MIPKEIISKAVRGGWQPPNLELQHEAVFVLDPAFWQALGKALGWWDDIGQIPSKMPKRRIDQDPWNYHAHRFYDLILTGGDTEKFWADLLK